ncbi:helix-turn-helix domain-containing protein [Bartonella sp. AP58NXGY]|uniref:helix-turn-helix domain-containing protein n=1 Tax=Bartonella sp. AP58NXGY TaxID=3243498 RepID=UPI0035CEF8B8
MVRECFGRLRSDQQGMKDPKLETRIYPALWISRISGSFCYVQVRSSTKSKRLSQVSALSTPGIPMRGRSQPAGELEVKAKNPHFNDISIGRKIRFKRTMLGMSQKKLGSQLGVTFQQIQKYEKGSNRIGAGRLQEIADILNVPISFFYSDLSTKENVLYCCDERISSKEEHILLKSFRELKPKKQKAILCLIVS